MTWHQLRKPRIIGAAVVVALLLTVVLASADYTQRFALTNLDPESNQGYGHSLAIEGNTIVVGTVTQDANGTNSGAAYVYRITPNGAVSELKLLPSRIDEGDQFGGSVAIDNGIIVIGARYARASLSSGDTGIAFVYTPDGNGGYTEQVLSAPDVAAGGQFGIAVAIDDHQIAVAASTFQQAGEAIYIFEADATGTFVQTNKITDLTVADTDFWGTSIALDDGVVYAGAWNDANSNGTGAGSVFMYTPDGSGGYDQSLLIASDGAASDNFGFDVAAENGTVIVGARDHNSLAGAVYIYEPGASGFTEDKLLPNTGQTTETFGTNIAIDNGIIVVGDANRDGAATSSGGTDIFTPSILGFYLRDTVSLSNGELNDEFGSEVAIDNGTVIVTARNDDGLVTNTGAIYIYNDDSHQMLENGGFEDDDSPDWTVKRGTGDKVKCNKDKNGDGDTFDPEDKIFSGSGDCAFLFKGGLGENSVIQQNVSPAWQQFSPGDTLSFAMWLNAGPNVNGKATIKVSYFDATPTDKINVPMAETDDYDTLTGAITIASPNVNRIKVSIKHRSPAGRAFVDNVSLRLTKASVTNPGYQPLPLPAAPAENTAPDGFRG